MSAFLIGIIAGCIAAEVLYAPWRVKQTKDPAKAKLYVKPTSTSDMYLVDECMIWQDGNAYRAKRDTVYRPAEYADDWEVVNEQ